MDKQLPKWLDKYNILHEDHINDLETEAAINEFMFGFPREEAESRAYDTYIRERAIEAAAHHLAGIKAASSIGDKAAASEHGKMYVAALKMIGYPEVGPPPPEVVQKIKTEPWSYVQFRPHDFDHFLTPIQNKSEGQTSQDDSIKDALTKAVLEAATKFVAKRS